MSGAFPEALSRALNVIATKAGAALAASSSEKGLDSFDD